MANLPISGIGAPILVILVILSLVSITIILVKTLQLFKALKGKDRRANALKAFETSGAAVAKDRLKSQDTPADRVAAIALDELAANRTAGLETTLEIAGNTEAQSAFRHIRTLETIAMISPLLGLLGTVLGMIQAFRDLEMAEGAANAALLAGGIWQALLTTAAGLIVALPAAAGAALLAARAEAAVSEIEATIARILAIAKETAKK
ncbi:MotA/TolQ/ExbB proton channel family protein [Rhodobacteraceae bacterium]|nr:MotA/TolQ/ExbB proton channel family protein [Paracoccaceae bacterium]